MIYPRCSMVVVLLAAAVCAGCDLVAGPLVEVYPARIDIESDDIFVPDTVQPGVPFAVLVPVRHRACDGDAIFGRVEVGQQVTVHLFHRIESPRPQPRCLGAGGTLFSIDVVWPHPGPFTLIIAGADQSGDPVALRHDVWAPVE